MTYMASDVDVDINELLLKLKSAAVDCKRGPSRSQLLIRLSIQKLNLLVRLTQQNVAQMQDKVKLMAENISSLILQFAVMRFFNSLV